VLLLIFWIAVAAMVAVKTGPAPRKALWVHIEVAPLSTIPLVTRWSKELIPNLLDETIIQTGLGTAAPSERVYQRHDNECASELLHLSSPSHVFGGAQAPSYTD
jgi:hypothetical protein